MSISNITIRQADPLGYIIEWSSTETNPLFYVLKDGRVVTQTYETSYYINAQEGETSVIDVFDSDDYELKTSPLNRRVVLVWQAASGAVKYLVEEYIDSAWVEQGYIYDDGKGYYSYETEKLADVTTSLFRVTSYNEYGDAATPLEYTFLVVGTPDAPDATIVYNDDDGKLTITI